MELSEKYLTYDEYKDLGGTLTKTPFTLLENESSNIIDIRTQNRLDEIENIPQQVKLCVFYLVQSLSIYSNIQTTMSENGNKASTSTDGYSESYLTPLQVKDVIKSKNKEISDILRTWLGNVEVNNEYLLYPGVHVSK